jgi:hypothetical protein
MEALFFFFFEASNRPASPSPVFFPTTSYTLPGTDWQHHK